MSTTMTQEERNNFLTEVHIGVLSINNDERGPLSIPIWYMYTPDEDLYMTTGVETRKGKLLKKATRVGFCVQSETPPYKYISMEGPITVEEISLEKNREYTLPLAHHYLGVEEGNAYVDAMESTVFAHSGPILVRFQPEHWLSFDGSKQAIG